MALNFNKNTGDQFTHTEYNALDELNAANNTKSLDHDARITDIEALLTDADTLDSEFFTRLCHQATAASITGTTAETVLFTGTIPANSIGVNGEFHIRFMIDVTNNANDKTLRVKFNGVTVGQRSNASINSNKSFIILANRNSLTAQVSGAYNNNSNMTDSTATPVATTYTIDTSQPITVEVTVQLQNAADSATLHLFNIMGIF